MVKFRPLGTAKAKGRSTALDIYEVVGVVRTVDTTEAGTGRLKRKGRCRGKRRPRRICLGTLKAKKARKPGFFDFRTAKAVTGKRNGCPEEDSNLHTLSSYQH